MFERLVPTSRTSLDKVTKPKKVLHEIRACRHLGGVWLTVKSVTYYTRQIDSADVQSIMDQLYQSHCFIFHYLTVISGPIEYGSSQHRACRINYGTLLYITETVLSPHHSFIIEYYYVELSITITWNDIRRRPFTGPMIKQKTLTYL